MKLAFIFLLLSFSSAAQEYINFETNKGNFSIRLYDDNIVLRENFKNFVRNKYYDRTLFTYNVKNQWLTLGDFRVKDGGTLIENLEGSSSVYSLVSPNLNNYGRTHKLGSVTLVKKYFDNNQNTSAFMITLMDIPSFDNQYQIIGEVTSGLSTLKDISSIRVGENFQPLEKIVLKRVSLSNEVIEDKNLTGDSLKALTLSDLIKANRPVVLGLLITFSIFLMLSLLFYMKHRRIHSVTALGAIFWGFFFYLLLSSSEAEVVRAFGILILMLVFIMLNKTKMIKTADS